MGKEQTQSHVRVKSDLVITMMKVEPTNPNTNDTIRFSAFVANKGAATAPASKVAVKVGGETVPVTFNLPAIGP